MKVKNKALAPRIAGKTAWMKRFGGRFGLVLALTAGTLLLPTPDGLSAQGHRSLAAFVFTASILALEPVSLPIAALMVPLAEVALGISRDRHSGRRPSGRNRRDFERAHDPGRAQRRLMRREGLFARQIASKYGADPIYHHR